MVLKIEKEDNRFRVITQHFSTSLIPDTPENRKVCVVFLRLLRDENGKPLFTLQHLACIVSSNNRQAASQHIEDFRNCGCDFKNLVTRQRKVDESVVSAVKEELMADPLATISELRERTNNRLLRNDLSDATILAALDQIPVNLLRVSVKREIKNGSAHYKESVLMEQMLTELSDVKAKRIGIVDKQESNINLSDPTSMKALVTPNFPLKDIPSKLKLLVFCLSLYYWGVPLSRLGQWFSCHKTTILRNLIWLSLSLWPMIGKWIIKNTKAKIVYIDEKWLKIRGKWHYWFVVLDKETSLPILSSLLPSLSGYACKFIALKLKSVGKIPKVIITDGFFGYKNLFSKVRHQICIFHHQQGVLRFLKEHFQEKEEIENRKKEMKKVFQTSDKRTVKRRFSSLEKEGEKLSITDWVLQTKQNLKNLISAVGSRRIPKTNNAIERFFRSFNRFYKTRCGFFSIASARRQIILFMVVYLFNKSAETKKAPIEAILPSAKDMPLYKILNDPFGALFDNQSVKIADFSTKEELLAQV